MSAEVIVLVTDMGNGGAFCSNCDYCLDKGDPIWTPVPDKCPNCNEEFVDSSTYVNKGGSDF